MDLIDKIKDILIGAGLKSAVFDLHFDSQNNVVGYVADELFNTKEEEESLQMIWNALKKRLEPEELLKVLSIFPETYSQKMERLMGGTPKNINHSHFWFHKSPDLAKYWLFVDVAKFGDNYKSFFLVINHHDNYRMGLTFNYDKEIIAFMELNPEEIYNELFNNAYDNGENEIKMHIMKKHEALTEKGLWGKTNIFNYVFEAFEMKPASRNQLLFSTEEISDINEAIQHIKDDFKTITDLKKYLEISTAINKLRGTII